MTRAIVPVKALPHNPPYKIHRYFARRPWNAFDAMIEALTDAGDVILDPFAGGGTTIYESAKLARAAIGCDINPLSNFIVRNMLVTSDVVSLTQAAEELTEYLETISQLQLAPCGRCSGDMECDWAELHHVCACPECGTHIPLDQTTKLKPGVYLCSNNVCEASIAGFRTAKTPRLTPVYKALVLSCKECSNRVETPVDGALNLLIDSNIQQLEALVKKGNLELDQTEIPRHWDRQKEDLLYEKGFTTFSDLFTRRNFLINSLLKSRIVERYGLSDIYEPLRFVFSDSLRDSNSMSFTNKKWQAGKPTTWSKHAYWLPNEFCEVNVSKAFRASYRALASSHLFNLKHNFRGRLVPDLPRREKLKPGEVYLHAGTLETLSLEPNSVDAIITDPPYGSNVQYLELSHFWHPWNRDMYQNSFTDSRSEAIVNRKDGFEGSKGYLDYEKNLYTVFSASFRALKTEGRLALTFNNKDLRAWVALIMSILRSGFRYSPGSIVFQDGVQNYRQTSHTRFKGSPFGDFVYVFEKRVPDPPKNKQRPGEDQRSLSAKIDSLTGKAFSLVEAGAGREAVLAKYFDKLVLVIQDAYLSTSLDTIGLYDSISSSELGKFYGGRF